MKTDNFQNERKIAELFLGEDDITLTPYGNGHINDTFLVTNQDRRYILQTVNGNVFCEPQKVMSNIEKVTQHLQKKVSDMREVMSLVYTKDNKSYYCADDGRYFRMFDFVEDSICLEKPQNTDDFYECAVAFGRFENDLSDFSINSLYETIPDFHNTVKRFKALKSAVKSDICGRADSVLSEIEFFYDSSDIYSVIDNEFGNNKLIKRVVHNDTKINNVMLDKSTRKALCVIDLDTVMAGYSVTDFGDAIRSGACTAAEDELNAEKVRLDMDMFTAFTKGFLHGFPMLTDDEIRLLPYGALVMTLECGMRFLTDYLSGDTYFKTDYDTHNLVRCRTQIALAKDIKQNFKKMQNTVKHI